MPRPRNIGTFRDRVDIQSAAQTPTSIGGATIVWSTDYSTWADVQEMRGDRETRYGQLNFNVMYEVKMRYRNGDSEEITTAKRIVYRGQNLTIHSIIDKHESYIKVAAYSTDK